MPIQPREVPITRTEALFCHFLRHYIEKMRSNHFKEDHEMSASNCNELAIYANEAPNELLRYYHDVRKRDVELRRRVCGTRLEHGDYAKATVWWDRLTAHPEAITSASVTTSD